MGRYKESRVPRVKQKLAKWPVAIDKELEEDLIELCELWKASKSAVHRRALKELADKYLRNVR